MYVINNVLVWTTCVDYEAMSVGVMRRWHKTMVWTCLGTLHLHALLLALVRSRRMYGGDWAARVQDASNVWRRLRCAALLADLHFMASLLYVLAANFASSKTVCWTLKHQREIVYDFRGTTRIEHACNVVDEAGHLTRCILAHNVGAVWTTTFTSCN